MALSPVPSRRAPDFTLIDQSGHALSLASFKGHIVVLEFMDPHCTDICPLVSQEFLDAHHDLGREARQVDFIAVNVNPYFERVANMAAFSREHGLDSIPTWHFFTGSTSQLRSVWHDYGVAVVAPNPKSDIIHTSIVYFIDSSGHERFIAAPTDDHTSAGKAYLPGGTLTSWGHGIALIAESLIK
jgi:cytochrome oxidase Cu insertion factor (SCO1/SenC/PrrC family)